MMLRFLPSLAALSAAVLTLPGLRAAEPGSIAPVTLALTVTGVTGAFPDADLDGSADFEKTTTTAASTIYEYKSKFVTTKITNASLINYLVAENVISDANYALVMAFNENAQPLGFFLIRKGETPLVTQPIDVSDYLYFDPGDIYFPVRACSIKDFVRNNYGSSGYSAIFSERSLMYLCVRNVWVSGMFVLSAKFDAAMGRYVVLPSQILSITGGDIYDGYYYCPRVIEGRINLAASKAADVSLFLN